MQLGEAVMSSWISSRDSSSFLESWIFLSEEPESPDRVGQPAAAAVVASSSAVQPGPGKREIVEISQWRGEWGVSTVIGLGSQYAPKNNPFVPTWPVQ